MSGPDVVKLDIGSGSEPRKDGQWTHIDSRPFPHVEVVTDGTRLAEYAHNSVDIICASHFLEHVPQNLVATTLRCWFDRLKPGGRLEIYIPDMHDLCQRFAMAAIRAEKERILGMIYGHPLDPCGHQTGFDLAMLSELLSETGFVNVGPAECPIESHVGEGIGVISYKP